MGNGADVLGVGVRSAANKAAGNADTVGGNAAADSGFDMAVDNTVDDDVGEIGDVVHIAFGCKRLLPVVVDSAAGAASAACRLG